MICCRYLFVSIIYFVFLVDFAFGLGPYKDNGETILDQATGLEWQKGDSSNYTNLTWPNALAYCEGMMLAGYDDWRLPNKLELRSVVEHSKIDPPVIDALFSCEPSWYWSSTSLPDYSLEGGGLAWLINFENGADVIATKDLSYYSYDDYDYDDYFFDIDVYARCVRTVPIERSTILLYLVAFIHDIEKLPDTGQAECYDNFGAISCPQQGGNSSFYGQDAQYHGSQTSYRQNNDFTVTDLNTNLIWQQNTANLDNNTVINGADVRNWQDAVGYCAGLTFADNSDWRLPTKYELQSIIDYGIPAPDNAQPAINSIFSSQLFGYWSATPFMGDTGRAWVIYFYNGNDSRRNKTEKYYIRCVTED